EQEPEPARSTGSEVTMATDGVGEGAEPATGSPTDGEGRRVGAAGYAGIGALAVGLGVTIGGVVVLTEEPEERLQASSARFVETIHRRPLGGALTGVGAGLLAAGVVLVVVDQTVLRKRRDPRRRTATLVPSVLPSSAGLLWAGHF
ncbi:MAG: hypothetical protein KDK70_19635, partial [Myxococcales bacterium]|nr:hypothetical protein [Myxococcales bacterium]